MDFFQDNYKPLHIRVKSRDEFNEKGEVVKKGVESVVNTKPMTPRMIKRMAEIQKQTEENPKEYADKGIYETLDLMFDKPAEFWDKYDFSLEFLTELIKYASSKANEKKN